MNSQHLNERKKFIYCIHIFFLFFIFGLCTSCDTAKDKKMFGQIVGASIGAYVGSKVGSGVGNQISTSVGVAIGAIVGSKIASILDDSDKESYSRKVSETLEKNPDNVESEWISPNETDTFARIKPFNEFKKEGAPCRDFEQVITKDGKNFIEKSTACRDESGNWLVV